MNVRSIGCGMAVVGLLLGNAAAARAQEDAQESAQASAQEGDVSAQAVAAQALTVQSVNGVDVWVLRCTTTPIGVVQIARARVADGGGVDGRRIYLHLTRQLTGRTGKTVARDGGVSLFTSVATGGAGSAHFVQVSKDRTGLLGVPEPYRLQAECIAGGIVRPHTLVLVQNQ
jgi:hypothetical protein